MRHGPGQRDSGGEGTHPQPERLHQPPALGTRRRARSGALFVVVADCKIAMRRCLRIAVLFALTAGAANADNAESLMNKAQAAHAKGDNTVALELANKAVEAAPRNPQCYYVRGRIYVTQAEHAKAVDDFDQALKIEPRGAEIYFLRGGEHFKLGHINDSIRD